uniref:PH01B019A14.24 protein n=1 Tax=Phyllostachys edulis TaxID=38705 RepID=L0P228_PHYED|nr:PH01B019A14.24 [Phyllostachys edulis]
MPSAAEVAQQEAATAAAHPVEEAAMPSATMKAMLPVAAEAQLAAATAAQMSVHGRGCNRSAAECSSGRTPSSVVGGAAAAAAAAQAAVLAKPPPFSIRRIESMGPYVGLYGLQQPCSNVGQYNGPHQQMGFQFMPRQKATFQSLGAS